MFSQIQPESHTNFFLDFLSALFIFWFCLETKIYAKLIFNLNDKYCNLAAFFVSIFPVWHTLVSFNISQYLFSFCCLLFGYRNFINSNYVKILIGLFFLILSFEVESSLSFVLGLAFIHLQLNKKYNVNSLTLYRILFLFLFCIAYYLLKITYFPNIGYFGGYNVLSSNILLNLSFHLLIKNIINYSTYSLLFIWIPIFYYYKKVFLIRKINFSNIFYNEYFLLIILSAFAIFPYLLTNKSSSIFYLSDYYQRHAFLLAPIFGIICAKLFNDMENNNPFTKKKYFNFYLLIFISINLTFFNYGNMRKIEAYHFKLNLIDEIKNYGVLPKGDIQIISKKLSPRFKIF